MKRINFLGIGVDPMTFYDLKEIIETGVTEDGKVVIGNHNLHSLYLFHHHTEMQNFYDRANFIHVDGMSLIFLAKILGFHLERCHRLAYLDWVNPLIMKPAAEKGWKVFYLGSKPGVAERGANFIKKGYPGLKIKTHHGYFNIASNSQENQQVINDINKYKPHILLVGMGMPRQECWISENIERIDSKLIFNCGAYIDYIAGEIRTPPRWTGKIGLEWLYRFLMEPRRLMRRYFFEPWFVVRLIFRELTQN